MWSKFQKLWVFKKLDKQKESFSPNTENFLAFFIVFEWGRILKSEMEKNEVKCNTKLRSNYFSVNVSVLAIAFRQQISKKPTISGTIVGFLKFVGKMQDLVRKRLQKSNKDVILHHSSLPIDPLLFPKFCQIQKQ